jgi:hypothetical protein
MTENNISGSTVKKLHKVWMGLGLEREKLQMDSQREVHGF